MKMIRTEIPDVVIIEPNIYGDNRGWFMESFNENKFIEGLNMLGLPVPEKFVQDNHSCSHKSVLRGLHYQAAPYAQGKLVRVVQGSAFDVAVDIRRSSPTYLKWVGLELSGSNRRMLWIPEGFAHGFLSLEDDTHFLYKTTNYFDKESERSIKWDDHEIDIAWPQFDSYNISDKDQEAPSVAESCLSYTGSDV